MAYVPPHKRHNKDNESPSPSSELPPPPPPPPPPRPSHYNNRSSRTNSFNYPSAQSFQSLQYIYSKKPISNWFLVGSSHYHNQLPPSLQLHPVFLESLKDKFGQKLLILVDSDTHMDQPQAAHERRRPWEDVAAKVIEYLLSSFKNVRSQNSEFEQVKPVLVARFGKILFHRGTSATQELMGGILAGTIYKLEQQRCKFYTNIPTSYMEKMKTGLPPELGFKLDYAEKEFYRVKLSDANRSKAIISCKCKILKKQNKLQLYKTELNPLRQMVIDVSCINKNLDLRLMLCPKRISAALRGDEMECIQSLIESAVIDPNVKGGLRWPLGKASSGDRFSVVGVWHTITIAYKNPSLGLGLKVRSVDQFDFRTSTGESWTDVYLKLKGIVSKLQAQKDNTGLISKSLKDTLKLIWEHFLDCDPFLG